MRFSQVRASELHQTVHGRKAACQHRNRNLFGVRDPLGTRSKGRPPGSFRIHVVEKETLTSGCSPLAILYGTNEFLERFVGIRWYMPGPLGEIVPKHARIVLPMTDLEQSPGFAFRWVGEHNDHWMRRNKQNRCDDGFLIYPGIYHTQADLLPHDQVAATVVKRCGKAMWLSVECVILRLSPIRIKD